MYFMGATYQKVIFFWKMQYCSSILFRFCRFLLETQAILFAWFCTLLFLWKHFYTAFFGVHADEHEWKCWTFLFDNFQKKKKKQTPKSALNRAWIWLHSLWGSMQATVFRAPNDCMIEIHGVYLRVREMGWILWNLNLLIVIPQ